MAYHACAIEEDGRSFCWGYNSHGQVSLAPHEAFVDIDGGDYHSVGLTADGRVLCWGDGTHGQCTGVP